MFTLRILIAFTEQIDSMKADLAKYLPHIKHSHRVEALARALGFKTYAALNAVDLFWDGPISVEVNWAAFKDYLQHKGFQASAKPLYLAAGRACIRLSMGFHDYQLLARHVYAERHEMQLDNILSDSAIEEYLRVYSIISEIPGTRTITKKRGAYDLKVLAEKVSFSYPDGEVSPPNSVAAGSVALAALGAGFWFRPMSGELQELRFNMLQSSIDAFERKVTA